MVADKCNGKSLKRSNNVRLKHHYRNTKICFVVIWFVLIWKNLLVQGANSVPAPSLALEFHPKELTCTLYMRKTTPGDTDLWQKLVYDNKKSILCLYTAENKTVPDPDISFLEQCTTNLIVGTDFPYSYVYHSVHSVRSFYHSSFIIVRNDGCRYYRYPKKNTRRPLVFYYFPSCEKVSSTIFPNAYLDYINSKGSEARVTYLTVWQLFPVHSFESEQRMAPNNHNYLAVLGDSGIEIVLKHCQRLFPTFDSNILRYCNQKHRFVYHLKVYFNLTLTSDQDIHTGKILKFIANLQKDKLTLWWFVTFAEILDDSSFNFFYCLPNHTPFLLSFRALASPFDLWTWIGLLLSFILLLLVRLQSKNNMGGCEKILSSIGFILEQSQPTLNTKGCLCLSHSFFSLQSTKCALRVIFLFQRQFGLQKT